MHYYSGEVMDSDPLIKFIMILYYISLFKFQQFKKKKLNSSNFVIFITFKLRKMVNNKVITHLVIRRINSKISTKNDN
jgi:hypothetical protein